MPIITTAVTGLIIAVSATTLGAAHGTNTGAGFAPTALHMHVEAGVGLTH